MFELYCDVDVTFIVTFVEANVIETSTQTLQVSIAKPWYMRPHFVGTVGLEPTLSCDPVYQTGDSTIHPHAYVFVSSIGIEPMTSSM